MVRDGEVRWGRGIWVDQGGWRCGKMEAGALIG